MSNHEPQNLKTCKKCNQEKAIADFNSSRVQKDGLNRWCKQCVFNHNRQPSERNKRKKKWAELTLNRLQLTDKDY